ncbi:hypothetical protein L5515_012832 [Caenorhabditis briggsae]|uniref:Uncharacterized protein n=1 Tax=Caenorhabditis briggsae TaxID=6238 RepID=A0AAE9ETP2_CAEBR|nr:hypothetical protein L5515_012832 [Caenorhabditis briggsae]
MMEAAEATEVVVEEAVEVTEDRSAITVAVTDTSLANALRADRLRRNAATTARRPDTSLVNAQPKTIE